MSDGKDITPKDKTIVIVDDGAATGSTILATVRSLRKTYSPKRIIVAIAVSPKSTVNLLRREDIDHIEVITSPVDSNFRSIQQFYQNFDQFTDNQVLDIIHNVKKKWIFSFPIRNMGIKSLFDIFYNLHIPKIEYN